jgi:hypothetical protein
LNRQQSNPIPNEDTVWARIRAHQGEVFFQVKGQGFTYTVTGRGVEPSTVTEAIARSQFQKAISRVPLHAVKDVHDLFGPSYLFAILMDPRIRQSDW